MENPVGIYFTGFFNRKFLWNFLIVPVRQVCGKRSEKDDGPGLYAASH